MQTTKNWFVKVTNMEQGESDAYGLWLIAAINIIVFLFFALRFLQPKDKAEWRNMSILTVFFAALFAEMYGFPLTIFILASWLGDAYPVAEPFSHKFGNLWVVLFGGSGLAWVFVMVVGILLLVMGYTLLSKGWKLIQTAQGDLITDGVYAYARHPQYTGLFFVIVGFLIQWPILPTIIIAPILLYAYTHLAKSEEQNIRREVGDVYEKYAQTVPAFFPPLSQWKGFFTAKLGKAF